MINEKTGAHDDDPELEAERQELAEFYAPPRHPLKGEYGGVCSNGECQNTSAEWFNRITKKYVCAICASLRNFISYKGEVCINHSTKNL